MSYATASLQSRSPPPARARKEPGSHHDCPRFPKLTLWVGGRVRDLFWQKEHPPPRPSPFPGPRAGRPRARSREPPSAPRRAPPACTPPAPGRRRRGLLGFRPRDPQQCMPGSLGSAYSGRLWQQRRQRAGTAPLRPGRGNPGPGPRACLTPAGGGLAARRGGSSRVPDRKKLLDSRFWPSREWGERESGTSGSGRTELGGGQRSRGQVECISF
jgi:hypothetical protein